jgi:hypothetical protein
MEYAMEMTYSNKAAAVFLRVSYNTWKRQAKLYIDQETGLSLFDKQCKKYLDHAREVRNAWVRKNRVGKRKSDDPNYVPAKRGRKKKILTPEEEAAKLANKRKPGRPRKEKVVEIEKKKPSKKKGRKPPRWNIIKNHPDWIKNIKKQVPLEDIMANKKPDATWHLYIERLIKAGHLEEKCSRCGYGACRSIDGHKPLKLHQKNHDYSDYSLDNVELLCYNCYYIHVGNLTGNLRSAVKDPITGNIWLIGTLEKVPVYYKRPDKIVYDSLKLEKEEYEELKRQRAEAKRLKYQQLKEQRQREKLEAKLNLPQVKLTEKYGISNKAAVDLTEEELLELLNNTAKT